MRAVAIALLCALPCTAFAQGMQAPPSGGRSMLMGGTGMSLGNDASATLLNPAIAMNITSIVGVSFSLFALDYYSVTASGTLPPEFGGGQPNRNEQQVVFNPIPTVLCIFITPPSLGKPSERTGMQRLSTCFGTVNSDSFGVINAADLQNGDKNLTIARSYQRNASRFAGYASYAVNLSERLSLGVSLIASTSSATIRTSAAATAFNTLESIASSTGGNGSGSNFGLGGLVGLTYNSNPATFGLTFQTSDIPFFGTSKYTEFANYQSTTLGDYSHIRSYRGDFALVPPWRVGFSSGLKKKRWNAEIDWWLGFPQELLWGEMKGNIVTTQTGVPAQSKEATLSLKDSVDWNVSVGVGFEGFIKPRLSIVTGFQTMGSRHSTSSFLPLTLNTVGGAIGLASHGKAGTLMLGVQGSYSFGDVNILTPLAIPPEIVPVTVDTARFVLVLAGSTDFSSFKEAAHNIGTKGAAQEDP